MELALHLMPNGTLVPAPSVIIGLAKGLMQLVCVNFINLILISQLVAKDMVSFALLILHMSILTLI